MQEALYAPAREQLEQDGTYAPQISLGIISVNAPTNVRTRAIVNSETTDVYALAPTF